MTISITDLVVAKTKEAMFDQLILAIKGIGHTERPVSGGLGQVTAQGTPLLSAKVVVDIIASGAPGVGTFQVSTDGGATFSGTTTIPSNGVYTLSGFGIDLLFDNTPAGASPGFIAGAEYAFQIDPSNIPVTSWQPFSTGRTLAEVDADVDADFTQTVASIAKGGYTSTASFDSNWAELLAAEFYNLAPVQATVTKGAVVLTVISTAGPYTIGVGDRTFATAGGLRFINTTGGTLTYVDGSHCTLTLQVQAESPGANYNVGNGEITQMVTPLAGVTVSNPGGMSGTWITSFGLDKETAVSLMQRCQERWPALGIQAPKASYDLWAKAASPNVTKTLPRVSVSVGGQIDLYLAGPDGPVDSPTITAVNDYITPLLPLTAGLNVQTATNHTGHVVGDIYIQSKYLAAGTAQISANLVALAASVAIGGTLWLSDVYAAMKVTGTRNAELSMGDIALAATEVLSLDVSALFFHGV